MIIWCVREMLYEGGERRRIPTVVRLPLNCRQRYLPVNSDRLSLLFRMMEFIYAYPSVASAIAEF